MGYCGNGVAMAPYLGHKAALKILNPEKKATVFEDTALQSQSLLFWKAMVSSNCQCVFQRL